MKVNNHLNIINSNAESTNNNYTDFINLKPNNTIYSNVIKSNNIDYTSKTITLNENYLNDKNDYCFNNNLQIFSSSRSISSINPNKDNTIDKNYNVQSNLLNQDYIFFKGEKMKILTSPYEDLKQIKSLIIEQKIDILEIISGCENANRYHIYTPSPRGKKKYLFKCFEISNCFFRNCCPSNSRKFDLKIQYLTIFPNKKKKNFAFLTKNFNCKNLNCCTDPEIKVNIISNYSSVEKYNYVGSIKEIGTGCKCDPIFLINDKQKKIKYKITTDYYQIGFFCKNNSLGKCYEVDFYIYNFNDDNKPCGIIHKYYQGLSELVGDSDAYIINFPSDANVIDKILLIGCVIMIDYHYFESNALCECNFV